MKKYCSYVINTKVFLFVLLFSLKGFNTNATTWTTTAAGPVTNLSNWSDGVTLAPSTFLTPGDKWVIAHAMTMNSSGASWTVGTAATTPDTVEFLASGKLTMSGAGTSYDVTIYGNVIMNGGTFSLGGAGTTLLVNTYGSYRLNTGDISASGAGASMNLYVHGYMKMSGGTIDGLDTVKVYGNDTLSGGTINEVLNQYVYGNCDVSGGTISMGGAGGTMLVSIHGNFKMTDGTVSTAGAGTETFVNVYGNCSLSGPCKMICSGAGTISELHLALPSYSGTMLIDNTSTGSWTKSNIYVDSFCTAQLAGNFSTTTGTTAFGMTVNGTLICPAAYFVNGTGFFKVNGVATLKVAHAWGINAAITTTGPLTFTNSANYAFNGSVAQVTGSYLPVSLIAPDTITISNNAGVTLTASTATTGTLLFTSGILHTTAAFTMSTPGTPAAVTGAGLTSYVEGTLIKTITGFSSVNYEVGDLSYAPMNLIFSAPGTGGSLGLKATNGLHPNVATSGFLTTSIANHYWTVTNYSAAGPATVIPKATYNLADIIGGSNGSFKTQEYRSAAWLVTPLATTNTSAPYTSAPNTGIAIGTIAGDFIYGSDCTTPPIVGTTSICVSTTTTLSDAGTGGTWSSSNTSIATVSSTGVVTGVAPGTVSILYTMTCPATISVTVGTLPITGAATICTGSTLPLSDATPGGTWSSGTTTVATVSPTGVVTGVSAGTVTIYYTFGSCPPVSVSITVGTPTPISGSTTLCIGSTSPLSDATPGGVWSSSNTSVATVSGLGIVTGVSAGTSVISYTTGSCWVTTTVTVSGTLSPITGPTTVCSGSTIALSDATPGGVWSSTNSGVATVSVFGVVTGVSAGTTNISYTIGSCASGLLITVSTLPPITGPTNVCAGQTISLSNATAGGVWSSGNTSAATVSSTGVVTGVASGTATIIYTLGACSVNILITVGSAIAPISGPVSVCSGATIALSDATPGGVWSSDNTPVATVSTTGVVLGVSAGTANISYSIGGCSATITVTVDANNAGTITGKDSLCAGPAHQITLSDNVSGGVWSSTNTSRATVDPVTGVVTGVYSGGTVVVDTIKYTITNSCGTFVVKKVIYLRKASQCATGVTAVSTDIATELKVFPNPNGGTFTINLLSDIDEEVHVVVTNIVGEKVREFTTTTNRITEIRLDPAAGIYLLSATTSQGRYIAKIVVN